jgi:DNA-binding response OmpR family regulator
MNTIDCFGTCPPRPMLWQLRVLIVAPDLATANFMLFNLEAAGAQGIATATTEQALAVSKTFHPDVLIAKLKQPNQSDLSLLDEIEMLLAQQKKPILSIAIADFPRAEDGIRKWAEGFEYYLCENLDCSSLLATVKRLMQTKCCPSRQPALVA